MTAVKRASLVNHGAGSIQYTVPRRSLVFQCMTKLFGNPSDLQAGFLGT